MTMKLFQNRVRCRKRTQYEALRRGYPVLFLSIVQLLLYAISVDGGGGGVNFLNSVVIFSGSSVNLASFLVISSALPHFASAKSIRNGKEMIDSSTELPVSLPQTNQSSTSDIIDPTLFASRTLQTSQENGTTTARSIKDVDEASPSLKALIPPSEEFEKMVDVSSQDVSSLSWEDSVDKTLREFERSKVKTEETEEEQGGYRLKRQMAQEIALIAPALATAGCIPKFFCGMNSKPPSEKTSTLNDLAYLIKVAMLDDDQIDIDDALFPGPNTRGKNDLTGMRDDLILENLAEEEMIQEDPGNIRWVSMDMEHRIKGKPGSKNKVRLDDELMDAIIVEPEQTAMGSLLTGIKSVFRIGRSVQVPEIIKKISTGGIFSNSSQVTPRSDRTKRDTRRRMVGPPNRRWKKRPFWTTPQFRQEMELAERIGKADQDDARCSTTFNMCPYTTHEMMDIVHGGYSQKRRRKKKKRPQWFMNNEGPPPDSSEEEDTSKKKFKDPDNLITTTTPKTTWVPNDPEQQLYYAMFPNKALERGITTVRTTKKPLRTVSTTPMTTTTESEHEYEDLLLGLREFRRPPMRIQGHVEYENDDEGSLETKKAEQLDVLLNNKNRQQNQQTQKTSWWRIGSKTPPSPMRGPPKQKPINRPPPVKPDKRKPDRSDEENTSRSNEDEDDSEEDEEDDDASSEEQVKKKPKKKSQKKKKKDSDSEETRSTQERERPEMLPTPIPITLVIPTQAPTIPPQVLPQNLEYAQIIIVEDTGASVSKQTVEPHQLQQLQPYIENLKPTPKQPPIAEVRPKYKITRVKTTKIRRKKPGSQTSPLPPIAHHQEQQPQPPTQSQTVVVQAQATKEEQKPKQEDKGRKDNKSKEVSEEEAEEDEESQENSSEERRGNREERMPSPQPHVPPQPIPPQNGRVIILGRPSEEDHRMNNHGHQHQQHHPNHPNHPNRPNHQPQMSAEEENSGENSNESAEMRRRPPPPPHHMRHNISNEYLYSDEMEGHRPELRPISYSYFKKRPRDEHNSGPPGGGGPPSSGPPYGQSEPPQTSTQKYSTGFLGFLFGNKDKGKKPPQQQQQQPQHHQHNPQLPPGFPPGHFDDDDDDDDEENDEESNERQDTPSKTISGPEGELEVGHLGRPPPKSIKPNFSPPQKPQRPYKGSTSMEDSDERKTRSSPPPPNSQQTSRPLLFLGKPHRIIIPPPATPPSSRPTPLPTLPYSTHSTEKPLPKKDSEEEPESEEEKPSEESKEDDESKEDSSEEKIEKSEKKSTTAAPKKNKKKNNSVPLPPIANYKPTTVTSPPSSTSMATSKPTKKNSKQTQTRTDYGASDEQQNDSNQTKEDDSEEETKLSREIGSGEESNEDNSSEEKKKKKESTPPPKPKRRPEDDELEHPSAQFPPQPPVVGDIAAVEEILNTPENKNQEEDDEDEVDPYDRPVDNIPAPPPLALQGFPTALEIVVPTNAAPAKIAPGAPLATSNYAAQSAAAAAPPANQPGPGVPLAGFNQGPGGLNNAPGGGGQGFAPSGGTSGFGSGPNQPFSSPGGGQPLQSPGPGGAQNPGPAPAAGSNDGSQQGLQSIRNPISSSGNRQPGGNRRPGSGNRRPGQNQNRNPQRGNGENEKENSSEEKNSSEENENESSEENPSENGPFSFDGFDGFDESILSLGFTDDDDDGGGFQKDTPGKDNPPPPPPIFTGGTAQKEQAQHKPFLPRPITPATPVFYRPGFKNEPISGPPPSPPPHLQKPSSQHPVVLPMRPSAAAALTPFIKRPAGGPTSSFSVSHLLRPLMPRPVYKRKPLDPKVVQWIRETYGIPDLNGPQNLPQPNRSGEHGDTRNDEKDNKKKRTKVKRKEPEIKKNQNKSTEKVTSSTLPPTPTTEEIVLFSRHSSSLEKTSKPVPTPFFEEKTTQQAITSTTTLKSTTTSPSTTTSKQTTTTYQKTTTTKLTTPSTQPSTSTSTSTLPPSTTSKSTTPPPSQPKKEEIKAKHALSKLPPDYVTEEQEAKMAQSLFSSEESEESEESFTEAPPTKSKLKTKVGHTKLTITVKSVPGKTKDKPKPPSSSEKLPLRKSKPSSSSEKKRKHGDSMETFSSIERHTKKSHSRHTPSSKERVKESSIEKLKLSSKKTLLTTSASTEAFKRKFTSTRSKSSSSEKKKPSSSSTEVKGKLRKPPTLPSPSTTPQPTERSTTQWKLGDKYTVEIRTTKKPRPKPIKLPPIYGKHYRRVQG